MESSATVRQLVGLAALVLAVSLPSSATRAAVGPAAPPLVVRPAAPKDAGQADRLYREANKLLRKKKLDAAIGKYKESLARDPLHIFARYNLACTYARKGARKEALAVLRQFREAGCVVCLRRLQRAREDTDFQAFRAEPEFVALTSGIEIVEPDYAALSEKLARRFRLTAFDPTFAAGWPLRVVRRATIAHPELGEKERWEKPVTSAAALRALFQREFALAEDDETDFSGSGWRIDGDMGGKWVCELQSGTAPVPCCRLEVDHGLCGGEEAYDPISRFCFWPVSADTALPILVELTYCDIGGF